MLRVTIDTNCLIDIDEKRPNAKFILELYQRHLRGELELAIVGIAASENQQGGERLTNIQSFLDRLNALNVGKLLILKPPGIWDVTFWDWFIYGSDENTKLQENIHYILFPNYPFGYPEFCAMSGIDPTLPVDSKWLNRRCDVCTLATHIITGRDVFIANDKNFSKPSKVQALIALGAKKILKPDQINDRLFE